MDINQIMHIVIGLVCGLIIMWLMMKGKNDQSSSRQFTSDDSDKIKYLESQVHSLKDQLSAHDNEKKEFIDKFEEIKNNYQKLIDSANVEIDKLNKSLAEAADGKIDSSLLANTDALKSKIAKLEKEVEDFEDKLDEAKDELSDEKKKLRRKIQECDELETKNESQIKELRQKEHKIEEFRADIQNVKVKLQDKLDEIKIKDSSLKFVQDVLTAPKVKDADVKALSELIDKILMFIQGELRDSISKWKNIENEKFFKQDAERWANTRKKTWLRNKTTIAFVGEFSAGKTSIVNRILSRDNPDIPTLPVSTKATTAIPTYVTGGSVLFPQFAFLTTDNVLKEINGETFEIVTKEVLDQVKGVSALIKYFVMKYKNENLKNLSILDTPGFNSNDSEDAIRTIEVINECDALFWVFDINNGTVNRSSIKTIKDNLTKPLYIVINKVDSKAKSEVDKVEQLIQSQLKEEGLNVNGYIRFSSKAPLNDIMKPIISIQKTEQEEYIDLLSAKVESSVRALNEEKKQANRDYNKKTIKVNDLQERFRLTLTTLCDDCGEVKDIPYYDPENGFLNFRDPNYKISVECKEKFDKKLNNISDVYVRQLKKIFEEQKPAVKVANEANNEYSEKRNLCTLLEETGVKLNKLVTQLNHMK